MAYRVLNTSLIDTVARPLEQFCINRFGKNGFKIESGIDEKLSWSPTIQIKRGKTELLAIEVSGDLFPMILKIMDADIKYSCPDIPITVYVACGLEVYMADSKQTIVHQLKERGFGLFTVDDTGKTVEQFGAIPLIHHIPTTEIIVGIKSLSAPIKVKFKDAFDTYRKNSIQGLQESGQLVEGLVYCLAQHCVKKIWIGSIKGKSLADVVDMLYAAPQLHQEKAMLGKVRYFIKNYRNMASHPPKNFKESASRTKQCRSGFIEAMNTCNELCISMKKLKIAAKLYTP